VVLDDEQYINASLIRVQLPMLARPCAYIATQGPLATTAADFWGMVYELRVPAIVMLTNVNECGERISTHRRRIKRLS
jgi:protein tyrosine phosphatase